MKIFISWSGTTSKEVALVLKEWLEDVIQELECFVSTSVEKGQPWAAVLAKELAGSKYGIFCVTKSNKNERWLNFEAGAISNQVEARVSPVLINMTASELDFPLAQYQVTLCNNKEDVFRLVQSINKATGEELLSESKLQRIFEREWPRLSEAINGVVKHTDAGDAPSPPPDNNQEKMLQEVLESVRQQQRILTNFVTKAETASQKLPVMFGGAEAGSPSPQFYITNAPFDPDDAQNVFSRYIRSDPNYRFVLMRSKDRKDEKDPEKK
jgi:hypothetical protein